MGPHYTLDGRTVDQIPAEFALQNFGVFTTFVVVDQSVLGLNSHLERLSNGARALWGHEVDQRTVRRYICEHGRSWGRDIAMRVTLFPDTLDIAKPSVAEGCRVLVSSRQRVGGELLEPAISVATVLHRRDLPEIKSTALTSAIYLRRQAQLAGYDDVLFKDDQQLLEGSTWALVVWNAGSVRSPSQHVLPSITVENLRKVADGLGWQWDDGPVTNDEVAGADLVLGSSVMHPVRPISSIDGVTIGCDTRLQGQIAAAYAALPRDPLCPGEVGVATPESRMPSEVVSQSRHSH